MKPSGTSLKHPLKNTRRNTSSGVSLSCSSLFFPFRLESFPTSARKYINAYHDFLSAFEVASYCDDDCDLNGLDLDADIACPDQFDGDNNGTRDAFLRAYGRLKNLLGERQIQQSLLRNTAQIPAVANPNDIQDIDF